MSICILEGLDNNLKELLLTFGMGQSNSEHKKIELC